MRSRATMARQRNAIRMTDGGQLLYNICLAGKLAQSKLISVVLIEYSFQCQTNGEDSAS